MFNKGVKTVFGECGRKFGKTDAMGYCLYRYALSNPNSACYYIAPFQKQAKELIWANNRLQNFFLPTIDPHTNLTESGHTREEAHQIFEELVAKYGVKVNDSEMRIKFGNGSFIKLDGADNYQAYRGINPHFMGYDEFKDHHPKFHGGMEPNLATFDAPLFIIGTPCEGDEPNETQFNSLADYAKVADEEVHFSFPSMVNHHVKTDFFIRTKKKLLARGEDDKWFREYMALRVKAGQRMIFPMLENTDVTNKETKHVKSEEYIKDKFFRTKKDWDTVLAFDPASTSTFAALLVAVNRYTKQILVLDEIYEQRKGHMSTGKIYPRAMKMLDKWRIMHDTCRIIYDNAAAWFSAEVADRYGYSLEPCMKDVKNKEVRLSLIKDILLRDDLMLIGANCEKFLWEMINYRVDDKGKIPKENDHLLDCFRYILSNLYYNELPPTLHVEETERRGYTMEEDLGSKSHLDPLARIGDEYFI